jgi:hypothetical protein
MRNNNGLWLWLIAVAAVVALVVIGTGSRPARAANDGQPFWVKLLVACQSAPDADIFLCWIHHVPEPQARIDMNYALADCLIDKTRSQKRCDEYRAYARQRWGY